MDFVFILVLGKNIIFNKNKVVHLLQIIYMARYWILLWSSSGRKTSEAIWNNGADLPYTTAADEVLIVLAGLRGSNFPPSTVLDISV